MRKLLVLSMFFILCVPILANTKSGNAIIPGYVVTSNYTSTVNAIALTQKSYRVPYVLYQSGASLSLTGTTNETTLATIQIPAGTMSPNSSIRISGLWSLSYTANTKTVKYKLGGTTFGTSTHGGIMSCWDFLTISNANSLTAQLGSIGITVLAPGSFGGNPLATGTVNTATDQNLVITCQLQSAGETATLNALIIEVIP